MQALAEGDLSERARQRAEDLGNDAALRAIAPKVSKQQAPTPLARRRTETAALSTRSDDRLPPAGSVIVRDYNAAKLSARLWPLTITAGLASSYDSRSGQLEPKKDLVATMPALLQTRRIQVAESLTESDTLVKELVIPCEADGHEPWRRSDRGVAGRADD
jgi:hypothetical protein